MLSPCRFSPSKQGWTKYFHAYRDPDVGRLSSQAVTVKSKPSTFSWPRRVNAERTEVSSFTVCGELERPFWGGL